MKNHSDPKNTLYTQDQPDLAIDIVDLGEITFDKSGAKRYRLILFFF